MLPALAAAWVLARPARLPPPPPATVRPAAPPALTVVAARAEPRRVPRLVPADGPVVAWQELRLGMEIDGLRVREVLVEEGQAVEAGQLLARLDDAVLAAQHARAAALVEEAQATLVLARVELARTRSLIATHTAARQALEQREADLTRAEARLVSLRAERDEVAARLAQTRIRAPDSGIVLSRDILPGSVSVAGQTAFRLLRQGRVEMEARVQEMDLASVQAGQPVAVRHGSRQVEGRVRLVAPLLPGQARLGIVYVSLPPGSGLSPGMFVLAEIATGVADLLAVPQEAVVFRDGAAGVFVLVGEHVALRRVTLGPRLADGALAVAAGLAPGEAVVGVGAGFLADGDRVRLAAEAPR
ncbi:efflux RND transporter periplasmic adaptor subunit [Siccirubricoccus phaeus]|uniref:efflux RND transporter periplasmic adaptor subunit n=1 Tax=Siccirubricoccus phaeus TaxID=2595053 RepID=UPI00165BCBCD|nr:efflux RND transporter periplasmic adaptor subunit [Siccirubricoccus phaeus]